jgi:hypothetical protein
MSSGGGGPSADNAAAAGSVPTQEQQFAPNVVRIDMTGNFGLDSDCAGDVNAPALNIPAILERQLHSGSDVAWGIPPGPR